MKQEFYDSLLHATWFNTKFSVMLGEDEKMIWEKNCKKF